MFCFYIVFLPHIYFAPPLHSHDEICYRHGYLRSTSQWAQSKKLVMCAPQGCANCAFACVCAFMCASTGMWVNVLLTLILLFWSGYPPHVSLHSPFHVLLYSLHIFIIVLQIASYTLLTSVTQFGLALQIIN